jgi:subtilisin family serine protease
VQTLKKYMNNMDQKAVGPETLIKVAVVDDGVDADKDDIGGNIQDGETFYDNRGHWPGYYQSTHGHGHYLACLIRQLCPNVRLYIAKLNELWVDGKPQITAESAAKVCRRV